MSTIATLAVKLIGDITGYTKSMTDAEKQAQQTAQNINKNLKKVGGEISGLGRNMTAGLTLPIVGAGLAAVNAASDLEETKNKVSVVFGTMSADVLKWSETSATALGQSRQQALDAAGTYGNLFLALGLGQEPAADMSMSLVQLASDLASFNNANPADVLEALQSGLIGQSEPMRKFGVNLTEAAVQAKAMQMGLADADGELTEAAKVQARYALILEQTTTAQGDFARTADGLANSTRIAKAQLSDAAAQLGLQLLPYVLQAVQWFGKLVTQFQALSPEQQRMILMVAGIVAVAGPLLVIIGSLVTAIGAIIPVITAVAGALAPFALPILAIIAVLALLYLAWTNNWGGIQQKTAAAWEFIKNVIAQGWAFVQQIFQAAMTVIGPLMQAFTAARQGDWYAFGENLRQAWDAAWKLIVQIVQMAWTGIQNAVSNIITNVINFFRNTDWGSVGRNIVLGIASGITAGATAIANAAMSAAQNALQAVQGFLGIHSESTVFEAGVGWEMAAGTASGFRKGLQKLLPQSFGMLQPAAARATPTATNPALNTALTTGLGNRAGGNESNVTKNITINISANLQGNKDIDYLAQQIARRVTRA